MAAAVNRVLMILIPMHIAMHIWRAYDVTNRGFPCIGSSLAVLLLCLVYLIHVLPCTKPVSLRCLLFYIPSLMSSPRSHRLCRRIAYVVESIMSLNRLCRQIDYVVESSRQLYPSESEPASPSPIAITCFPPHRMLHSIAPSPVPYACHLLYLTGSLLSFHLHPDPTSSLVPFRASLDLAIHRGPPFRYVSHLRGFRGAVG